MPKPPLWLIRAVDADLMRRRQPSSMFVPLFALILLAMVSGQWSFVVRVMIWVPTAAVALAWYAFVGWRSWRRIKAAAWHGDRHYDREGKYRLPPEYADTESLTVARKRRWRQKWRRRQERP